jgi:hypothetical protein
VNGLKLTDITCNLASPDARPGLVCEDVDNIDVSGGNLTAK